MLKRPHHVAFLAVLLGTVVLLNLPDRAAARAKLAVGSLFIPLFGVVGSAGTFVREAQGALSSRKSVAADTARLAAENRLLRLQLAQATAALAENDRLRQLLGWQRQLPWKSRAARVIARDPENWWRTLRIDAGSRDGLRNELPVLGPDGLIGRTGDVGLASAQVVLVGDPKCRVSVLIRETGENGIISALSTGVLDHRLVDLTHLPRHSLLKPGQTVITSGLGGVFPAGIPVGTVVDSRTVGYGLMTEARVKLGVDTARLNEVMVLVP